MSWLTDFTQWAMVLIAIYLILVNGDKTVQIMNSASSFAFNITRALQGR
jgi:hypothetical protein